MKTILVGCLLTGVLLAGNAWSDTRSTSPVLQLRAHQPSDRDLLGGQARLALPATARAMASAGARSVTTDTLHLAVLRVEFVRESPDDPDTSGNGTFDLSAGNPDQLDPPPHDPAYFERQLHALGRYFSAVSNGQLKIRSTLYPAGTSNAFTLPRVMRYYNPDTTTAVLDIRLAEFFRDAIEVADAGGVDFGDVDALMIFHAGIGQDLLADDVPPSDIPSAFISLAELQEALAPGDPDYAGIAVDQGARFIRDGLWVGETNVLPATDLRPRIEFSLLGVMANLMGSQLGLPSLFNTDSGAPGIGRFGLMDQGAGNEAGRLPAAPCAWSRLFLGWEQPVVVTDVDDFRLGAVLSAVEQPLLALIPIDSREYFLLENRQQDQDGNGTFTLIDSLGTIVGVEANEYDGAIPGSGLLIWHIDEAVIEAGLAGNTVNADFIHRGVDLEEADGVEDIGLRPDGGYGLQEDLFYDPNATRFGPSTHPPTTSNRGHATHIVVDDISASGLTMSFDVAIDVAQPGWPDSTRTDLTGVSMTAGDIDEDGADEVAWVSVEGMLGVRRADGTELFPPIDLGAAARGMPLLVDLDATLPGLEIVVATEEGVEAFSAAGEQPPALAGWGHPTAPATGTDLVAMLPSLAEPPLTVHVLVMIGEDGLVHLWSAAATFDSPVHPGGTPRSNLSAFFGLGNQFMALVAGDELVTFPIPQVASQPITPAATPLPSAVGSGPVWLVTQPVTDSARHWIIEQAGRIHAIDLTGEPLAGWPRRTGDEHLGPPALADLRGDGFVDLILPGTGRVWAFTQSGALIQGWPAVLDTAAAGMPLTSGALLTDLDGDGALDVVVGSPAGGLAAFDGRGARLDGWPLAGGRGTSGTPVLADLDGDRDIEIVTTGDGGWVYAYDLPGAVNRSGDPPLPVWAERGGRDRLYRFSGSLVPPAATNPLLAESSITIYPNPTRGATAFRYELGGNEAAEVQIRLIDATGRRVRDLSARGIAGTLNEIRWDGRDEDGNAVPSGVYVVRIAVRAGEQTVHHLRHLAVTR